MSEKLKLKIINEGMVKLYVPDVNYYSIYEGSNEPSHAPVFYNSRMIFDRDLSILVLKNFRDIIGRDLKVCDSLSGTGVRGLRYGLEVDGINSVWFNDWNPLAVEVIHKNLDLNSFQISATVSCLDARLMFLMNSNFNSRFHVIDIDPFGSPAKYFQPALNSLINNGLMCITATDIPALFGKYPYTCWRRYGALPISTSFSHEISIRILLGFLIRNSTIYNFSFKPLLCYSRMHYIRFFLQFIYDKDKANEAVESLGYIAFCKNCLYREVFSGLVPLVPDRCPNCGSPLDFSGPLWVGSLFDPDFINKLRFTASNMVYVNFHLLDNFLKLIQEESNGPPTFYVLDEFSKKLKFSSPNVTVVIDELKSMGFFASRTHFHPKGIRTNAPTNIIFNVVKSSSQ